MLGDPRIAGLITKLHDYNFVSTITLTLDVTDTEGLSPTLSLLTNYSNMQAYTSAFGLQLNGTQERNDTENCAVHLCGAIRPAEISVSRHWPKTSLVPTIPGPTAFWEIWGSPIPWRTGFSPSPRPPTSTSTGAAVRQVP